MMFTVIHLAWKSVGQDIAPECKFKCALLAVLCSHKTYQDKVDSFNYYMIM